MSTHTNFHQVKVSVSTQDHATWERSYKTSWGTICQYYNLSAKVSHFGGHLTEVSHLKNAFSEAKALGLRLHLIVLLP